MDRALELDVTDHQDADAGADGGYNGGPQQAHALRTPAAREIIEIDIRAETLAAIHNAAQTEGVRVTITADGHLGLRFPDGGLIELNGTEAFVAAIANGRGLLLERLNGDLNLLDTVLSLVTDGVFSYDEFQAFQELSSGELQGGLVPPLVKGGLGARPELPEGSSFRESALPAVLIGTDIAALTPLLEETNRWGRDDLKRGEFGSTGQSVSTATGQGLGHLTGLGDEEIGRRNGEKIINGDNSGFAGAATAVGASIDHLWLLGDVEYIRASGDLPEDASDPFEIRSSGGKVYGPLTDGSDSFKLIEDNTFSGKIFDPAIAGQPIRNIKTTINPAQGTVVLNPDGTFVYTPPPNYSGFSTFTYSFIDPRNGQIITGKVTLTVAAVADAPIVSGSAATNEDTPVGVPVSVDLRDKDGSEEIESVVITGVPSGATLAWDPAYNALITPLAGGGYEIRGPLGDIQALLASLTLSPPKDFHGQLTFDVAVTSVESKADPRVPGFGDRETVHHTYVIRVEAVADPVTATGDAETTDEDTLVHLNDLAATFGDSLDGSETHKVEIRGVDADAKLTNSAGTEYTFTLASDGTKTYVFTPAQVGGIYFLPPPDESGTFAGMTIVAIATEGSNGDQEIASAPVSVVVNAVADPVDIVAPTQATDEDTPVTFGDDIAITVLDPFSQTVTQVVVAGFPTGTIVTYTPVGGGMPVTITTTAGGSVTLNGGTETEIRAALATLTLTPPPNTDQNISLSVSVTTTDGSATDTQTVPMTITVAAVADGPNISGSASGNEDQPIAVPVTVSRIDADGSESYDFAEITVPAGVSLTYTSLPFGITATAITGGYRFEPGAGTTAAQFEQFLANNIRVQAPADSDINFDVTVKAGTLESTLSGGEVSLLKKDQTVAIPVAVHPVVDMPAVTGSSTVDEDTSVNFGADIAITENDKSDGSEAITKIVLGNIPLAATITYTAVGGAVVTVSTAAGISKYTISGGTEDDIRDTLATFTLTPPLHSDVNIAISVAITKADQTATEGEAAATATATSTHTIAVAAVADGPNISGSASGNEDQLISVPVTVSRIDADGSESYDFATITVPTGVTLSYTALPFGITATAVTGGFTFTPGAATTAAQFEQFLASNIRVQAPADSDVNFDVTVKVGTIESTLSGGEVTLLKKDLTATIPVAVHPVIDAPVISGTSTVNEDGIVNPADQTVTAAVNFGANIGITAPDSSDGSEAITKIVITGLPVGAVVTYTPVGGSSTAFTVAAGTTSLTLTGGTETEIRAALATLSLVPPPHRDNDISLGIAVTKTDATSSDAEAPVSQTFNGTHVIKVAAIADVPTLSGSGSGLEDQNISVSITAGHPDNTDGSEKIKTVVIGALPAGLTLTESSPGAGLLTLNGDGTYTVTGPTDAAINDVLANLTLVFAPGGARQHLDTDFNLSVTVTTIESSPGEIGAGQITQLETAKTFSVPVTVTAVADGVTESGSSVIVEDVAKTIGSDITWSKIDADGSEDVTAVVITGFPPGSTVTYTDLAGNLQSFVAGGGETVTLSGAKSATIEAEIRAALDTLNVQAPTHSDDNFTLNIDITTEDNDSSATTQSFTHDIVVQAVADAPSVDAPAKLSVDEDKEVALYMKAARSADGQTDESETLSVRFTIPQDGGSPIGTMIARDTGGFTVKDAGGGVFVINGAATGDVTFTDLGNGVYLVEGPTGATAADANEAINAILANGIFNFAPRAEWSGVLTGSNGILVEAISTEAANGYGAELAPNDSAADGTGGDTDTKIEITPAYIDFIVEPINDVPVLANSSTIVQENTNSSSPSDPDLIIPIGTRLGLSIADTDGSQGLSMTLTGFPKSVQALAFGTSIAGVTTSVDIANGTVTISGADANDVLTVLNSLSVTLADDRDANFTVTINGTSTDTNGVSTVTDAFSLTHTVTVQAVADTPTVDAGAATKAFVNEDSGFVTYPVTVALNDTDGSETYKSVVVEYSTAGVGTQPSIQFGTTAGVTFDNSVVGKVTLTGPAAAIQAAMLSLEVKPGANNDADITIKVTATSVESNPSEANSTGPGVAGTEISIPTAQTAQSFVIPVAAVADAPSLSGSGAGLEDQNIPVSITVSHADTADGSEKIKNVVIGGIPAGFTMTESSPGAGVLTLNADGTYTVTGPTDAAISDVLAKLTLVFTAGGARQHLDTDFNLTVTATTIESNPSETGTGQGANNEASTTVSVPITVTAVVDGLTKSGSSTIVEDIAKTIGTDISYSKIDADGSENVTSVVISGIPAGTTVSYTDMLGAAQSFVSTGTETVTFAATKSAANETAIRTALNSLNITAPLNSDVNITLNVSIKTEDNDSSTTTQAFTHTVVVQAVADTPSVAVTNISLNEDATIKLAINPDKSPDTDNSETLSVRITVPSDGSGVIGALASNKTITGVTFTSLGGGVYTVTATGASAAVRETRLDSFLNDGVTFTPRAQWSGVLTGTNGIKVEAISTEAATGGELAAGSFGGADGTSKTETATKYIDVTVAPVNDIPVLANASTIVQENTGSSNPSDPDLVIAIGTRLGLTIADTDGSQTLNLTLSGFPTNAQSLSFGTTVAGVTFNIDGATKVVTISGPASGVLTMINSLSITLADDRDENFTVSISGSVSDTNGTTTVTDPVSLTHTVTVQAVADTPTVDAGAATKTAVDEDSGFISYPVTVALNDTDGSETFQSVVIEFSAAGSALGSPPVLQFGTTTGVTFDNSVAGTITLTGSAANLAAAMASLQVRPGADNGEDITIKVTATAIESNPAEDNNGATAGMGGGIVGPEISVPTAATSQTFVIPVNPLPEPPTITLPGPASGTEDTTFAIGTISITTSTADPDGSEARFVEIDTSSFPTGTVFLSGGSPVGTPTGGWLRIPESALTGLTFQAPPNFSGTVTLSVRGVVVDTSTSGTVTLNTAAQNLSITVTPVADGITHPTLSVGVEDVGPVTFGADLANITTGIKVTDNGSGTGNNAGSETISKVVLDFPADTATQIYNVSPGALAGSAQIAYDAGTNAYTITSTIITSAASAGLLSQADRAQAEADIRATLNGFTVTMGPTHTDLNGIVDVTATTLDVSSGLANTKDNTYTHTIRIQAVADTPGVTVDQPSAATAEDGPNIPLIIHADRSADDDGSETMSVRITIPSDGLGTIGTLVGTPPPGVTLTNLGGGIYLVEATGATAAAREAAIDSFLDGGGTSLAFNPRNNWSGQLTGTNGIKVEVISTEAATGVELAAGSFGGADGTSKTETVVDYIDVRVAPVADAPTVKGNGVGLEDTIIAVPMSVTLNDKDGSETFVVKITAVIPAGTIIYGAGGAVLIPDGMGVYTLTPADVSALAVKPPLNYSSAVGGDIQLTAETVVTDTTSGGTVTSSFINTINVHVTGVADQPGTRTVNVTADEDDQIQLGSQIVSSAGGNLNNLLVDTDGSEALSFVIGGLPAGIIPVSSVAGVSYLGNGTWSVSAAAMPTLTLPPVQNFSGENPYTGVTVRAVTQEIDGSQASSPQWPVTITVNPVIAGGTVDGFASWGLGVTRSEAATEGGSNISLASASNYTLVDNDGSEQVVQYTFDLSNLIADAGLAVRLAALPGAGSGLDKLVANYVTGTFVYNPAAGTITVQAANIGGVALGAQLFLNSNQDFNIPVMALVRDTAIIAGSPVTVDKTETGSLGVNLTGTADVPTVFATSTSGNSGTSIPVTLGGTTTDTDVALGRTQSEDIFYVLRTTNTGTAPLFGLVDGSGNVLGLDTGNGSFLLRPSELADLRIITPSGVGGTINLQLTTVATENDGDRATNSTNLTVTVVPQTGTGPGTAPLPPTVTVGANSGNEDGSITLNVTAAPAPGDTTNPAVSVIISGIPAGAQVIGAILLPPVNVGDAPRWVATAAAVNGGLVTVIPPPDFSGTMTITVEGIARNANLQSATSGATNVPVEVDPAADGVAINATPPAGTEDQPIDLNITLGEKDIDGSEVIGSSTYVKLNNGATLIGSYAVVLAGDADATIDGTSLVGYYRVPTGSVGSLQAQPAANWHGTIGVTIAAYSVEPVDPTPDADDTKLNTANFSISVTAIADAPLVTAPTAVSGNEDTAIMLTDGITALSASLVDTVTTNGAEVLSVKIAGVPDGSRFSAGSNNGDGSWTIPVSSLGTLSLTPPLNYSGTITLTLTAIALELSNGNEAQSSVAFNVVVAPKADSVEILAKDLTIDVAGQVVLDMNVRMADTTGVSPGENAPEMIRITFTSVPTGVSLSATAGGTVINPSAGTYEFLGTQAQANAIAAIVGAGATGGNYTVNLSAVTIDGASILATPVTDSFILTLPAIINGTPGLDTLTGGSGTQLIFGLAGDDTLNGGAGADRMTGGDGSDTYVVDNAGDIVVELAGEGAADLVQTSLASTVLSANAENLIYTGAGNFAGTGNGLDNVITGGTGNDTLNGGAGADTLIGGTGNDTYVVDSAGDIVTEGAGAGTDLVQTTLANYVIAANVENLTFTGTGDFTATGNSLDNIITGGIGNDTLSGAAGNDTLVSGGGNDTLDGGTGNDAMTGGTGNDIYVVDSATDTISELLGEGTDTVQTTLASFTLGANVENLTYTGAAAFTGTGNGLDNILTGGTAANILNGGAGNDTLVGGALNDTLDGGTGNDAMTGGAGNDTYVVDSAGDVVTEGVGAGTDTVQSTLAAYTLSANVENLTLTGAGSINGTGNTLANILTGNTGNNILDGGAGADTLSGGGGTDTLRGGTGIDILSGGTGADTFLWQAGDNSGGTDQITDFTNGAGNDKIDISAILVGFTGSSILSDFVQKTEAGGNTTLRIDTDGAAGGSNFVDLVVLQGHTGLDLNQMKTNGNLIV